MKRICTPLVMALTLILLAANPAVGQQRDVGRSPWGPTDQIGRLNLMTAESQAAILSRVDGGRTYDLSVEYFIGMPSWQAAGDPHYRIWMTHTPRGTSSSTSKNCPAMRSMSSHSSVAP